MRVERRDAVGKAVRALEMRVERGGGCEQVAEGAGDEAGEGRGDGDDGDVGCGSGGGVDVRRAESVDDGA